MDGLKEIFKNIHLLEEKLKSKELNADEKLEDGTPLLIEASFEGNLEKVELLLKYGANIHITDNQEATAIMRAALSNNVEVMKKLREHGSEIDGDSGDGITPLIIAVCNKHIEATEWLIREGADINKEDSDGNNLLRELETHKLTRLLDIIEENKNRFNPENLQKYHKMRFNLLFH